MFEDYEIISRYTRKQAFADGYLVDTGPMAREVGFRCPVALTASVHANCCAWPETNRSDLGQCVEGRMWDVLSMARNAAKRNCDSNRTTFTVLRIAPHKQNAGATPVELVLHIGPGDKGEPVATIMFEDED